MVGRDDVAVGDADGDRHLLPVFLHRGRDAERERERVGRAPFDLGHLGRIGGRRRPEEAAERVFGERHAGQPDGVAASGVGVSGHPRSRSADLLEDHEVARGEAVEPSGERGPCRALRQAAVRRAPRVEADLVVLGVERGVDERLERLGALAGKGLRALGGAEHRAGRDPRQEHRRDPGRGVDARQEDAGRGRVVPEDDLDPRAGVAAVVHGVVNKARVTPDRDASAGRAEIGLGRDRVLTVGQVIADVRQELDERDAEVGGVPLAPRGTERRDPVQEELPEARVVAGEVVDVDGWLRSRRADPLRFAVEVARAFHLEGEVDRREHRVDDGGRLGIVVRRDDPQPVDGEVTARGRAQDDRPRRCREHRHAEVAALLPLAPLETQVIRRENGEVRRKQRVDEREGEPALPEQAVALRGRERRVERRLVGVELCRGEVRDLQEVDAVQGRLFFERGAAVVAAAEEGRSGHAHLENVATRLSPVRRTT